VRGLLAAETPIITIFGKSWDFHVDVAIKTTLDENLRMISYDPASALAQPPSFL
jgi:2-isopropylmalate synthase